MPTTDAWDPTQYDRFRAEREAPFVDLLTCVERGAGMRVLDLGCGTGALSARLARELDAAELVGVDRSDAMLAQAAAHATERVRFVRGDLREWLDRAGEFDLVFTHAALQWVPDHAELFPRLLAGLKPGAQLAVQMPNNFAHASHVAAAEVAREDAFARRLAGVRPPGGLLALERYAELFAAAGLRRQRCVEKIYGHELASTREVVAWVRGTLLTAYLAPLDDAEQAAFVAAYTARLVAAVGERAPYFFAFRRMLLWGRKADAHPVTTGDARGD